MSTTTMYTCSRWRWAGLLALAGLGQCTPAQSPHALTDWVVANQTADTLRVTMRVARDSVRLTPAEVVATRHQAQVDSESVARQNGFYQSPWLQCFTRHRGQWYLVQNTTDEVVYYADHDPSPAEAPRVDRLRGLLTYRVPPHRTQHLLTTPARPAVEQAKPTITGLWVQAGSARQALLPGQPLLHVFRAQATEEEHAYSPHYRYQLTVGPGLTINP